MTTKKTRCKCGGNAIEERPSPDSYLIKCDKCGWKTYTWRDKNAAYRQWRRRNK